MAVRNHFHDLNHEGSYPEEQRENAVWAREWPGVYTFPPDSKHEDSVGTPHVHVCVSIYPAPCCLSESPLDCKEIKPVNPTGNQPWILLGRADAEAEAPVL